MCDRKTCSNLSDPDTDDEGMSKTSDVSIPSTDVPLPGPSTSFQQDLIPQEECRANEPAEAATTNTCRKAKFTPGHKESLDGDILQAIKSMGEKAAPPTLQPDEDLLFFQSLVPKMKLLDPLAKMECQTEIQMLVLRYVRRALAPQPPSQVGEQYGNSYRGAQYERYAQSQSRSDEDPYFSGSSSQYQTYSQQ